MRPEPLRSSCGCTSAAVLFDGVLSCASCRAPIAAGGAAARPYSQRTGERPAGTGKPKYLRVWRAAVEAGDTGAWSEGRARLMSVEAWAKWARTETTRKVVRLVPPAPPSDDAILIELGAKRAS